MLLSRIPYAGAGQNGFMRLVRRVVVLLFAAIQLVLLGRILLDLGVLPAEGAALEYLVPLSDALARPIKGLGGLFGGGIQGLVPSLGGGLDPAMGGALIGWTVVEGLVLRSLAKFAAI